MNATSRDAFAARAGPRSARAGTRPLLGVLALLGALLARPPDAGAEGQPNKALDSGGGEFGTVALWDVSGITGGPEGYENQIALVLSPGLRLGRLWRLPAPLRPLRLDLELSLTMEVAGNDPSFRGGSFASPTLHHANTEALALDELGRAVDAEAGAVDGTGRRALLSNLWLQASHPRLARIPWAMVDVGATLAFTFPTSTPSINAGLVMATSLGVTLGRTLWDLLTVSYALRYVQYLFRHATADVRHLDGTVTINGRDEALYQPVYATVLNPSFGLVNELSLDIKIWRGLSFAASYALINTFTRALPEAAVADLPLADPCADGQLVADAVGGHVVACGDRAERDSHRFRAELSYRPLPALLVSLALYTTQPLRHEGNAVSSPFLQTIPRANYTTVQLGVTADLERSYAALRRVVRRLGGEDR